MIRFHLLLILLVAISLPLKRAYSQELWGYGGFNKGSGQIGLIFEDAKFPHSEIGTEFGLLHYRYLNKNHSVSLGLSHRSDAFHIHYESVFQLFKTKSIQVELMKQHHLYHMFSDTLYFHGIWEYGLQGSFSYYYPKEGLTSWRKDSIYSIHTNILGTKQLELSTAVGAFLYKETVLFKIKLSTPLLSRKFYSRLSSFNQERTYQIHWLHFNTTLGYKLHASKNIRAKVKSNSNPRRGQSSNTKNCPKPEKQFQ